MALSDTAVRHAKITGKAYTLGDSEGLSLAVSADGSKCWHFRYSWNGKQKRLSFGTYPEVSLKQARARRDSAHELVAGGINPRKQRDQERTKALLAEQHTFLKVFQQWFEFRKLSLKAGRQSTLTQILRIFERDILPSLGAQSIFDVRRPDLLEILEKIERRGAWTTAEKSRTWLHQMFRYALVKVPGLEQSPATDLDVVAAPRPPVTHNPFLRMAELTDMLRTLRSYKGMLQTQLGLRLLLLTGVRTGELRLATPDQFDLERGLWVIPPETVKQLQLELRKEGKSLSDIPPYIVPLSQQAMEIIRYLLGRVLPAQKYLLTHRSELTSRISENTLNNALHRMGYANQLTGHGIRATISTALNEIGYLKLWVDAQLSHTDPDKVSSSYNHAEYVEQHESTPDVRLPSVPQTSLVRLPVEEHPCFPIRHLALQGKAAERFLWALKAANPKQDPATGRCLGTTGINLVMTRVQNAIVASGFVTTRILASPQGLTAGTLTLTVVPGRIHSIRFAEGTASRATAWNAMPARRGDLLNVRDIEQALENFKRVPTVEADIQITPAEGEGAGAKRKLR